jgi:DNA-binding transcriptional LysR family regulator
VDWNDLRYFLAVYRAGSSSAAARALGVQHTTVGRRLAALEAGLGTSLFTRTPTGLTPTSAAADILNLAEAAETSVLAIERQARSTDAQLSGRVRLTTSDAFAGFFVRHLDALYAEHPALQVEVLTGNRNFDLAHGGPIWPSVTRQRPIST